MKTINFKTLLFVLAMLFVAQVNAQVKRDTGRTPRMDTTSHKPVRNHPLAKPGSGTDTVYRKPVPGSPPQRSGSTRDQINKMPMDKTKTPADTTRNHQPKK